MLSWHLWMRMWKAISRGRARCKRSLRGWSAGRARPQSPEETALQRTPLEIPPPQEDGRKASGDPSIAYRKKGRAPERLKRKQESEEPVRMLGDTQTVNPRHWG